MEEFLGIFDDDGNRIDINLIPKPGLCLLCKREEDHDEEVLCFLNRWDQREEKRFFCGQFDKISRQ